MDVFITFLISFLVLFFTDIIDLISFEKSKCFVIQFEVEHTDELNYRAMYEESQYTGKYTEFARGVVESLKESKRFKRAMEAQLRKCLSGDARVYIQPRMADTRLIECLDDKQYLGMLRNSNNTSYNSNQIAYIDMQCTIIFRRLKDAKYFGFLRDINVGYEHMSVAEKVSVKYLVYNTLRKVESNTGCKLKINEDYIFARIESANWEKEFRF